MKIMVALSFDFVIIVSYRAIAGSSVTSRA